MKKLFISIAAIVAAITSASACVNYAKVSGSISGNEYATNKFGNNSIGGKIALGFTSYTNTITLQGTFEMYGKGWGASPLANAKDYGLGLHVGVNPLSYWLDTENVDINIVSDVTWQSVGSIYNGYGLRLELGNSGARIFMQYEYGFEHNFATQSNQGCHKVEVGISFAIQVGNGKVF